MTLIPIIPTTSGYGFDTFLGFVDASFQGELSDDKSGYKVAFVGDVNGDNFDDIMINAIANYENGLGSGQTYLIFGSSTGWNMDMKLSDSDASFQGEDEDDWSGYDIGEKGDLNGDGFDDLVIGAWGSDDTGPEKGEIDIIFGKSSGWSMDTTLYWVDGSFMGETSANKLGQQLAVVGDVNGDGYDDMVFGSQYNDEGPDFNAGQTYLILGKKDSWSKHQSVMLADASFIGENGWDESGSAVAGAGDVNGDGLDDFIIGAKYNDDSSLNAGKVYLIFGRTSNWKMDISLSEANATFLGEKTGDWTGEVLSGAGDVNGDGYDDFMISVKQSNVGGNQLAGQVYLIFGRKSGWEKDTDLGKVNASFWGEHDDDHLGGSVACAGDVNGDGFDDIIMSAPLNDDGGSQGGQTYLVLGKATGWGMDTDLSNANASFVGDFNNDESGGSIAGGGDINGDGYDDILIGASLNDDAFSNAGQSYLIFPYKNKKPSSIDYVKIYIDNLYTEESEEVFLEDNLYIELKGTDTDASRKNVAEVMVTSDKTDPNGYKIRLIESGKNSGIFRGQVQVKKLSHESHEWIGADIGDTITAESVSDPLKKDSVNVVPVRARFTGPILTNGDGIDSDVVFAKYKHYNFQFQMSRIDGLSNQKSFLFEMDSGEIYKWNALNSEFESIKDLGYSTLDPSSAYSISDNKGKLDFNITFNWTYPNLNYEHAFKLKSIRLDDSFNEYVQNVNYSFISKLNFSGELNVDAEIQGALSDGDVVRTNEKLTWSGLTVTYNNFIDFYPHDDEFDVKLSDNDGGIWFDNISEGQSISIISTSDSLSDINEEFTLEIIGTPITNIIGIKKYPLIIDGEDIAFLDLLPDNRTWQTIKNPTFEINITDIGGGLVDPSSIEYRISLDNASTWSQWAGAYTNTDKNNITVTAKANPDMNEGIDNFLQWRGKDSVSNGHNNSDAYRIKIDSEGITYSTPTPSQSQLQNSTGVVCGIRISDSLSGVRGQSIEYSISTDNKLSWSDWNSVNAANNGQSIKYSVKVEFENGTLNYIKWRGTDVAGNDIVESEAFQVIIDITISDRTPKVTLSSPLNNSVINKDNVDLYWQLKNAELCKLPARKRAGVYVV